MPPPPAPATPLQTGLPEPACTRIPVEGCASSSSSCSRDSLTPTTPIAGWYWECSGSMQCLRQRNRLRVIVDDGLKSFTDNFQGGILTLTVKEVGPLSDLQLLCWFSELICSKWELSTGTRWLWLCHVFRSIWSMPLCRLIGGWWRQDTFPIMDG